MHSGLPSRRVEGTLQPALGDAMILKQVVAVAIVTLFSCPADAQTLAFSEAFTSVSDCNPGSCSGVILDRQDVYDYDINAQSSASAEGRGSAQASATPGAAGTFALPVLKIRADVLSNAVAQGYAYGFQGYRNISDSSLALSYVGNLDFTGTGLGFVTPSIAILSSAVRDRAIGELWVSVNATGGFVADCSTPAAIAVVSGSAIYGQGSQSASIDTAAGTCGGIGPAMIAPGQEFYVLSRLLAYQYQTGFRDASHTFITDISPLVAPETRARLATALAPISLAAAVPEPTSWALLIVGFGAAGTAMRRRRALALA